MKGYKVLVRGLYSARVLERKAIVKYVQNKKVFPRYDCGPLCVFESFEHALAFALSGNDEIWECEYEPSDKLKVSITFPTKPSWASVTTEELPAGTRLAKWVKLIKKSINY